MTKREMILKELPFLRRVAENIGENVKVQRIDETLLRKIPSCYYHDGSCGVSKQDETYLVLSKGKAYKVESEHSWSSNYAHEQSRIEEGETILNCIIRNRIPPQEIQAIIEDRHVLDDWIGQEYINRRETIVYLPPKDKSLLPEALKKYQEELVKSVRKEIADARG